MEFLDSKIQAIDDFRIITLKTRDFRNIYIPLYFLKKDSQYFKAMFSHNFIEAKSKEIITSFDYVGLKEYYTLILNPRTMMMENPLLVMEISEYYGNKKMKKRCVTLLSLDDQIEILKKSGFDTIIYNNLVKRFDINDLVGIDIFRKLTPPFYFKFEKADFKSKSIFLNGFCVDPVNGLLRPISDHDEVKLELNREMILSLSLFELKIEKPMDVWVSKLERLNGVIKKNSNSKKIEIFNKLLSPNSSIISLKDGLFLICDCYSLIIKKNIHNFTLKGYRLSNDEIF